MSLASYWRTRELCRDTIAGDVHLVVSMHNGPDDVLACSVWPFVASEVKDCRMQRNFKEPSCKRCQNLMGWLRTHLVIMQLKEQARVAGVLGK